ncbi:MAG: hypothetical protein LAN71_11480 [Acidobacteriia bacterium]|nr:hypothetical protein [Terriglobia bacterium]
MMNTKSGGVLLTAAILTGAFVYMLFVSAPRVSAIPAFARKYQTSCTTCHSNYPELNDFGEAFKKNGFKFPKDDEVFVKEPPVMLGSKAQKEAFPGAVYPGEMPGSIPIGFRYSGFFTMNNKRPLGLGFTPRTDMFTPNTFTIISAGSFGQNISFWIDDDVSTGGSGADGGLGDGYLKFNDLGHYLKLPKDTLNVRFGQFELDLPFSEARSVYPSGYDIFDQMSVAGAWQTNGYPLIMPTTNNPFTLGAPQRGIEIGGYPNDGNFSWSIAVVNGSNDGLAARNSKDVYARISQKFNLERDSTSRKEVQAAGPTGPRDHTSIRVGAFYYYGRNVQNVGSQTYSYLGAIREPFYRVGTDLRFKYRHAELFGVLMYAHDRNHLIDTEAGTIASGLPVTYSGGFAGLNYWLYPWMIASLRYDAVNSPADFFNGMSRNATRNRITPGLQILVRSNIKVVTEYQHGWEQPNPAGPNPFFRANTFVTGIDYSF